MIKGLIGRTVAPMLEVERKARHTGEHALYRLIDNTTRRIEGNLDELFALYSNVQTTLFNGSTRPRHAVKMPVKRGVRKGAKRG